MTEPVNDVDEPVEDEEAEDLDDLEPPEEALAEGAAAPAPEPAGEGDVESIEELLVKKEAQAEEAEADEEEDVLVSLTREERLEPVDAKVVPPTTSEFVCKRCFLVKHKSQLKDKKRMLCRDCA
jgi:Domain of unknown function (DUF4193)